MRPGWDPTKQGFLHSCTIDDVKEILNQIPKKAIEEISLIDMNLKPEWFINNDVNG